jgi:Ni,Fe-hydrogenase III large subunit
MDIKWFETRNNSSFEIEKIPVLVYEEFFDLTIELINGNDSCHCVNYFVLDAAADILHCVMVIADDSDGLLYLFSHKVNKGNALKSITAQVYALHIFEREIHEKYGIWFDGHPWLKPVRYSYDRANKLNTIANYPFFKIKGEDLHQVGVGPIHAGVIEPGHFRFICNGEKVLHLEIQLGFQHKGIENIFAENKNLNTKLVLAESIAGDSVVGHTLPFVMNLESLAGYVPNKDLIYSRTIALELERIAIHIGDLSAQCTDIAYQLGSAVFGALRTPTINYFQFWCGNRFARTLIRPFHQPYPLTEELVKRLKAFLIDFETKFTPMVEETFALPSVLSRFEKTGHITKEQMHLIGAVGIPARITGLKRDIRHTHPTLSYKEFAYNPYIMHSGDIYAHAYMRVQEIYRGFSIIRRVMERYQNLNESPTTSERPKYSDFKLKPNSMAINMVEGWRGETCHITATNANGEVVFNKVKDPSTHNWMALALAVRNQEISDFPICNKSFDQSYCGFDL